jgi:hypothetical protein
MSVIVENASALINIYAKGRAALIALGNEGTRAAKVTEIGIAGAPFDDTLETWDAVPNEVKRITSFGGKNIAADTIHVSIQDAGPDEYPMYGFGIYLEDGTLLGAYCQDTPIIDKSKVSMSMAAFDIRLIDIDVESIDFGDAVFSNPPATETVVGVARIATQAEVDAGTDDTTILTPKKAAKRFAALTGAAFTGLIKIARGIGFKTLSFDADDKGASILTDGPLAIGSTATDGAVRVISGGTETGRFTPASQLLIGMTTTVATEKLQVTGGGRFDALATINAITVGGALTANGATLLNSTLTTRGTAIFTGSLQTTGTNDFQGISQSYFTGRVTVRNNGGGSAELAMIAGGAQSATYLRARIGGGVEFINASYTAVPLWWDDPGNLHMSGNAYVGGAIVATNGDIYMPWAGAYLSTVLSQHPGVAVCQWNTGVNNFGLIANINGPIPAPWVVVGMSGPGNGTANAISVYGVQLRNA